MTHLEVYQFEKYVPQAEKRWLEFANNCESILGHSLDGDLSVDGYSLDRAYSHFLLGSSPRDYAKDIRSMTQYKK